MSAATKEKNLPIHLMAGGVAGLCEALACHPLGKTIFLFETMPSRVYICTYVYLTVFSMI